MDVLSSTLNIGELMVKSGYLCSITGITKRIATSKPLKRLVKQFANRSYITITGGVKWIKPSWNKCVRVFKDKTLCEGYIVNIQSREISDKNKFVKLVTVGNEEIIVSSDTVIQTTLDMSRVVRDLRIGDKVLMDYTFRHKGPQEIAIADIDYVRVNSAYTIETKGLIGIVCNKFIIYGDAYYES